PNEIFIMLVFDLRVGGARGMLNLALPATVIEAVGSNFSQGWHRTRKEQSSKDRERLTENLGRIPVPVTAALDSKLSASDVLQLPPGDVLSVGCAVREPVDVKVAGSSKFAGRLMRLEHSTGVLVETQSLPVALEGTV